MSDRGVIRHRRVAVRRIDLTAGAARLSRATACLSPAERAYAERGTADVRIRRVLVRAALRELLGELLGVTPRDVPLSPRTGRPALDPRPGLPDLDLSCSASGDVGLVAVMDGGRVGVDVQRIGFECVETALIEGWLSVEERGRISALPAATRPAALTRAWVQKEAVLKGQGVGLGADMSDVRSVTGTRGRIGDWRVSAIDVPAGYEACVAVLPRWPAGRLLGVRPVLV